MSSKNTSISLGKHFDNFVENKVSQGRFKNVSEVIRAGLRLLEEEENRVFTLKSAITEGLNSNIAIDFDPSEHLKLLKSNKSYD